MQESLIESAKRTIRLEAKAIEKLANFIDEDFVTTVKTVSSGKGRLVISGIGKSGIIAQKIAATLNSTGTPSLFMHAADAIHGDLGMIQPEDIVMLLSKSGESSEIKVLVPLIKSFGNILIGMGGNAESFLAKNASFFLNTSVEAEACPNNLAPTTSTTAQLVMGDAFAICLMELAGFNSKDFARIHPGGNLGKRLYLRVKDVYINNGKPAVFTDTGLKEIILTITKERLGATAVLTRENNVAGIITDGDLRRMLQNNQSLQHISAVDILHPNPKMIHENELAVNALEMLRTYDISQLIVIDANNKYLGILHLHDLVREGIV